MKLLRPAYKAVLPERIGQDLRTVFSLEPHMLRVNTLVFRKAKGILSQLIVLFFRVNMHIHMRIRNLDSLKREQRKYPPPDTAHHRRRPMRRLVYAQVNPVVDAEVD